MDQRAIGNQVYTARVDRGLTHESLAEMCAISPGYLRQIEQGTRLPSLALLVTLCEQLEVPPTFLLLGNLSVKEPDAYDRFLQILHRATPRQAEIIVSIMEVLEKQLAALGE